MDVQLEDNTAGTNKASEFWGNKANKDAQDVLKATLAARKMHADALKSDEKAQPKKTVAFVVDNPTEAQTWKLRIESQLRRYLKDTDADTGIRGFKITNLEGNKRKVSFVPAVLRRYESSAK